MLYICIYIVMCTCIHMTYNMCVHKICSYLYIYTYMVCVHIYIYMYTQYDTKLLFAEHELTSLPCDMTFFFHHFLKLTMNSKSEDR